MNRRKLNPQYGADRPSLLASSDRTPGQDRSQSQRWAWVSWVGQQPDRSVPKIAVVQRSYYASSNGVRSSRYSRSSSQTGPVGVQMKIAELRVARGSRLNRQRIACEVGSTKRQPPRCRCTAGRPPRLSRPTSAAPPPSPRPRQNCECTAHGRRVQMSMYP